MRAHVLPALLVCALLASAHPRPAQGGIRGGKSPDPRPDAKSLWGARKPANRTVVCKHGTLVWKDDGKEVALFGVNYYPPFCIDFQNLGAVGANREQTIRDDVAHFVRMGLDLIRLHCWDRELSDAQGDLLDNEHLRLLDFLLAECKRNGIYAVLTPIAWWPTAEPSAGFSNSYPMPQMTSDPKAWEAQRRYLGQFVRHRNRYTGVAYGDEPSIAAFELINEPIYPPDITDERIVSYIDTIAGGIREAGCRKPIFYNGWGGRLAAVARSIADGSTFSWYPTGLASGHAQRANFLPRVADFPDMRSPALGGKAIGVYEFDAADVAESYMYPAMARSFRAGGAQFAAQFEYDALPLAPFNASWQTHFLNLAYTPNKAVSFIIAADAFRNLPRRHPYRAYPANCRFGEYRVSWQEALSERVGEKVFLYSNNTRSKPPRPERLQRIVGCGSSPVVSYDGTGAYFLDRISPGNWRLEVYPDAVWVTDPFAATHVGREVARLYSRKRSMRVLLPDLGERFVIYPRRTAKGGSFTVMPGVYLLHRAGAPLPAADWRGARFVVPRENPQPPTAVRHDPPAQWAAGAAIPIRATVATRGEPAVAAHFRIDNGAWRASPLRRAGAYGYAGAIPAAGVQPGLLSYYLTVMENGRTLAFPGGRERNPAEDNRAAAAEIWSAAPGMAIPPMAVSDAPGQSCKIEAVGAPDGKTALRLSATGFGEGTSSAGVRLPAAPPPDPSKWTTLVVRAHSLLPDTTAVELGLVQSDGSAFGCNVPLNPGWSEWRVPIADLRALWGTQTPGLDVSKLHEISLVFGAWLYGGAAHRPHALEIESVRLEQDPAEWRVPIVAAGDPVPVVTASTTINLNGVAGSVTPAPGKEGPALRVSVPGFGTAPSCTSWLVSVRDVLEPWKDRMDRLTGFRIRARAGEPGTTGLEIVWLEEDGAPWGTTIALTRDWQDIEIPWSKLRFFGHWWHPADRGGPGDRFHPARISQVNFCFGAWLFPEKAGERHAVEIEKVWLESGPNP